MTPQEKMDVIVRHDLAEDVLALSEAEAVMMLEYFAVND